jgi:DNA repair photolyase
MQLTLFNESRMALPQSLGHARIIESQSSSILTAGQGRTSDFDYTLNAYRGCSFACSYCFAAAFVADEEMKREWGQWVEVKTRAIQIVKAKSLSGKRIFMSSATDPYQSVEKKLELTRGVVEALLEQQARLVVQTRGPLVARDIDLFKQFDHIRVNLSITTDSDAIRRRFEPTCASIERRLDAAAELVQNGIKTNICILPMLPLENVDRFAARLKEVGPAEVAMGYFRHSDRPFTSTTRDPALDLAREMGWDRRAFQQTKLRLQQLIPELTGAGFNPE